jgi:hypothetical protein
MYIKNIFSIFTLVFFIQALIASDAYSFSHDKLLKDLNTIGKVMKKGANKKSSSQNKEENNQVKKENAKPGECTVEKNYIYFNDVRNYKNYKNVMSIAFERGKGSRKTNLDNISYILKSPDKDYEVEYVAKILKVKKDSYGTIYYGKFTATNLKTCESITYDFSNGAESRGFAFLNSRLFLKLGWYDAQWYTNYSGMTCQNEMNPQCMKKAAKVQVIGFRDLKNNYTYAQYGENYKTKVAKQKAIAEKKAEEKRILEAKKKKEMDERVAEQQRKRQKVEQAKKEEYKRRQAIANRPDNVLFDSYGKYIALKKFHDANPIYVSYSQISEAKTQVKAIEKKMLEKDKTINKDDLWERAASKSNKDYSASTMSMAKAQYTRQFAAIPKLLMIGLSGIYNKQIGPKKIKKDF